MRLSTGGDMLNFGYWEPNSTPLSAQQKLCSMVGELALLKQNQMVLDVGSGYGAPAIQWKNDYDPIEIFSLNINFSQLLNSNSSIFQINGTATILPFSNSSFDRILAFESAQHFKPLNNFVSESFRVLKEDGNLTLAIPVVTNQASLKKLGLLSMTWSSEHYSEDAVVSSLQDNGFLITSLERIGTQVYDSLADYYQDNRDSIRKRILNSYPNYVEKILYKSIKKMKDVSQQKIIDYMLISCKKQH